MVVIDDGDEDDVKNNIKIYIYTSTLRTTIAINTHLRHTQTHKPTTKDHLSSSLYVYQVKVLFVEGRGGGDDRVELSALRLHELHERVGDLVGVDHTVVARHSHEQVLGHLHSEEETRRRRKFGECFFFEEGQQGGEGS